MARNLRDPRGLAREIEITVGSTTAKMRHAAPGKRWKVYFVTPSKFRQAAGDLRAARGRLEMLFEDWRGQ